MATRILTGSIYDISENARPDFALQVVVSPTAITPTGIIPESTEPIATDDDGNFNIEVVTGIQLEVWLYDAFRRIGTTTNFGNGNIIKRGMVVPHGVSPITVQAVLALATEPDAPGDLITLANEHIGNRDNPHEVTPAQLHLENVANVSPADLPISDATQIAIDAVDDAVTAHTSDTSNPHSVTAHQTDAYTQAETDSMVSGVASALAVVSGRTGTLENRVDAIDTDLGDLDTEQSSTALALSNHVADMGNPHGTTKAQVGLVNVDNTADLDKPVSTAAQNALNLKANSADLGSAAFASTGDFATATQGGKADSAVQPAALDGLNADRHTHANKAVLDGIGALNLAPNGGLVGQVLSVGPSGRVWQGVPGIVYPSVILSPGESANQNGPVVPAISGLGTMAGQYGTAWLSTSETSALSLSITRHPQYTVIIRSAQINRDGPNGSFFYSYHFQCYGFAQIGSGYTNLAAYTILFHGSDGPDTNGDAWGIGAFRSTAMTFDGTYKSYFVSGVRRRMVASASVPPGTPGTLWFKAASALGQCALESALIYPVALPDAEVARISNMPMSWTMNNAVAFTLPGVFTPTNKIASGTTNVRTAPGAATTLITALAASTLIQDSGARVTETSVVYAQVSTNVGGGIVTGWIPASQIAAL